MQRGVIIHTFYAELRSEEVRHVNLDVCIPYVLSTLSRRPAAVYTRQLNRFLFNRFQFSSDARPQGAVYSTVLASLGQA